MEIAFNPRTKLGSKLLMQDSDFRQAFRRAILWNWFEYWGKLDNSNLGNVACGPEFGFLSWRLKKMAMIGGQL